jgi:cell division protein FtsW
LINRYWHAAKSHWSHRRPDFAIIVSVYLLLLLGAIILFSVSPDWIQYKHKDRPPLGLFWSHLTAIAIGTGALVAGMSMTMPFIRKITPKFFMVCAIATFVVTARIPFFSIEQKGAHRWLNLFVFQFQPSELLKIAFILMMAKVLEKQKTLHPRLGIHAFIGPGLLFAMTLMLVVFQPNLSMTLMIASIGIGMLYFAGFQGRLLSFVILIVAILGGTFMMVMGYAQKRIDAWLNPHENIKDGAAQQFNAVWSLGNGGITGAGLSQSTQKLGFLPEPFSDMAFATLGETMGLMGTTVILVLLGVILFRGLRAASRASENFSAYACVGLTLTLAINTLFHIGVCTSLLPPTGQPLPFISYGGTNLVMSMFTVGLLLNFAMHPSERDPSDFRTRNLRSVR